MGRIDLLDVYRHEDDDYGRGRSERIENWKKLVQSGDADRACDVLVEYERETPPPALLHDLASATVLREADIDRRATGSRPSFTMKRHRNAA